MDGLYINLLTSHETFIYSWWIFTVLLMKVRRVLLVETSRRHRHHHHRYLVTYSIAKSDFSTFHQIYRVFECVESSLIYSGVYFRTLTRLVNKQSDYVY